MDVSHADTFIHSDLFDIEVNKEFLFVPFLRLQFDSSVKKFAVYSFFVRCTCLFCIYNNRIEHFVSGDAITNVHQRALEFHNETMETWKLYKTKWIMCVEIVANPSRRLSYGWKKGGITSLHTYHEPPFSFHGHKTEKCFNYERA